MSVTRIVLTGHLTRAALLAQLEPATSSARTKLVVDCLAMTGYDGDARELFVSWNREHRHRIPGIAILTTNPVWSMVIATMSLASSQRMRACRTMEEGLAWLETIA